MLAIVWNRLDVGQAGGAISEYIANSGEILWCWEVDFSSLEGYLDTSLCYGDQVYMVSFVDADFIDDQDKRRSITTYMF